MSTKVLTATLRRDKFHKRPDRPAWIGATVLAIDSEVKMDPSPETVIESQLVDFLHRRQRDFAQLNIILTPTVAASWRRSFQRGLDASILGSPVSRDARGSSDLIEHASSVLGPRHSEILRSDGCLTLTDADGLILQQWEGNTGLLERMHSAHLLPGFVAAEGVIGTTSAITLESHGPVIVRGPEHFADQFSDITSSGMVITHPVTRAVIGSLHLTNDVVSTSPLALNWVTELARLIEESLLNMASREQCPPGRERRQEPPRMQGAVTWRYGERETTIDESAAEPSRGAVAPTLVGESLAWRSVRRQLERLESDSFLLVGEPGTGKRSLARVIAGSPALEISAEAFDSARINDWLRASVRNGSTTTSLIIRQLERLSPRRVEDLQGLLTEVHPAVRVIATANVFPGAAASVDAAMESIPHVVAVPPLRDRRDDIPLLLQEMTQAILARRADPRMVVRWMPDSVAAMTNMDWPENLIALQRMVGQVLRTVRTNYIRAEDLPEEFSAHAKRRRLVGLERIEAHAILQALHDTEGNKLDAARQLGIARSTLYRKMRALGIDENAVRLEVQDQSASLRRS
ncbi:helix-turn-helix domain-containing protein [Microbacterium sp. CH12i]|uniref:helix-turn-helix domain-containing protein n=1 Tax=Microbacterium sp. CH12i TaxID=1479651 RepID=UPI001364364B|nr:helix-turn-helix domain-containing protein [Microbacterium sp. CH12i]